MKNFKRLYYMRIRIGQTAGFTLLICLMAMPLTAQLLAPDSAFNPVVRSRVTSGFLIDNDSYYDVELGDMPAGLDHPFSGIGKFGNAVIDFFRIGEPRQHMLDYAFADTIIAFKSRLNVIAGYDHRIEEEDSYGFWYKGFRFNSKLGESFRLRALWWNGGFYGDLDAAADAPLIDGWHTHKKNTIQMDNLNADISFRNRYLTAALGRGKFRVGDNISGSIILNDHANDFGYLLSEGKIGAFTLSFMHGSLMADSTRNVKLADESFSDKYIAIHQISYRHKDLWQIFGGESIIYGNRSIDVNYLLPHTFWRVTEHNQGDRDNVMIYAGATYDPHRNARIYLTAALDELRYAELFGNWWGNKWAVQSGVALDLPALSFTENLPPRLTLELTAVRPWTYTHYMNHTMYSHDGRPLGYPKGSNLMDISLEANLPVASFLYLDSIVSYTKQGSYGSS
ncbi:MAG: hypothetical protein Q8J62_02705, partial [Candidatus Cloacimonadaceae bacterium]|nr:hypothetical protein [Candidatus Cloacimonadaceae bacterium]